MVQHLKEPIRRSMLAKRDALSPKQAAEAAEAIAGRLFASGRFREAQVVAFYLPKGNEVDTKAMIARAIAEKKEVLVPVTGHEITFVRFTSFEDLAPGKYGIPEPRTRDAKPGTGNRKPVPDPDVIIVPGVAFGLCMHRLGYGKGYYDRFLATSHAYRIGICYDFQVVEKLPAHEDDERMDEIITEKRAVL